MYLLDFWTFGIDDVDVIKKPCAQQIEQARKDNKPTKKRKDYIYTMSEWTFDSGSPAVQASAAAAEGGGADETADRTSIITGRLKTIYRKSVLPVEKRFKYDYFYESPFMSDAEFDGTCTKYYLSKINIYSIYYIPT